jgi:putative mRNA 3-end processing factor
VDPVRPVPRAVFTGEHRFVEGCVEAHLPGPGGLELGGVKISFHPSGYAPFAAQVRLEAGEVSVVTGDFKRSADPLSRPFEVLPCDELAVSAPFGLPIFEWDGLEGVAAWLEAHERCTLYAAPVLALRLYAQLPALLAQNSALRLDASLEPLAARYEGRFSKEARKSGNEESHRVIAALSPEKKKGRGAKAIADASARLRGPRRRSNFDAGFALSEHASWSELLKTVEESRARRVLALGRHGEALARFLREERGLKASGAELHGGAASRGGPAA